MGRLIPAGTGMEYYRAVKIAGEDVVEEEVMPEPDVLGATPGLRRRSSRRMYTGGLIGRQTRIRWRNSLVVGSR